MTLRTFKENTDFFNICEMMDSYMLYTTCYSGTAGDGMVPQNGYKFSTKDRDLDINYTIYCASEQEWTWWYKNCPNYNQNGLYLHVSGNLTKYVYSLNRKSQKLKIYEVSHFSLNKWIQLISDALLLLWLGKIINWLLFRKLWEKWAVTVL